MEGHPVLFLDNLNNMSFSSNLLASAITERPAKVRLLGRSHMVQLNSSAFVILTGNGLRVSEDLARRFITVEFDAVMEIQNPASSPAISSLRSVDDVLSFSLLCSLSGAGVVRPRVF